MTFIFAIIGAIIGSALFDDTGFIPGAILGYLLASVIKLNKQVVGLQKEIRSLMTGRAVQETAQLHDGPRTHPAAHHAPSTSRPAALSETSPTLKITPDELEQQAIASSPSAPVTPAPVALAAVHPYTIPHTIEQTPDSAETMEPVAEHAIIRYVREYFSGPNLLVRVGVIVLFFGVAFLLKYAAERTHLPIEFRLIGVAIGAIVMLVTGWRLRTRHPDYALVMQGGAIGVLYLTVFSALRLFEVLPASYALIILTAVGIFSAILAIVQNARSLAILGICGGFLAPVLTSTGAGSHIVLFSYYALLNAGIFGMAWFKAWRPLNLLGFAFTFVIATFWGVTRYSADNFASTEPFLILFFLFYVAISVLYANRQAPELKNYVDGTLVFGTPIIAFGLQAGMMQQYEMLQIFEYGLAVSAVVLSLFYVLLAKILFARQRDNLRLLVESFLALGIVFATLAIPLALDGRWTAGAWALEGAAVLWMGVRQNRVLARIFGTLLQFAAGFALLDDYRYHAEALPVLNSIYIGGVLVSVAALFSAWFLQRNKTTLKKYEPGMATALFVWGLLWWVGAGLTEIERLLSDPYHYAAILPFITLSSLAFSLLGQRLAWPAAKIPALGLLPALALLAYAQWFTASHPFADLAWTGWLIAFALIYVILKREEHTISAGHTRLFHMATLWLLTLIAARESAWAINALVQGHGIWSQIAWAIIPGMLLGGLILRGQQIRWPVFEHYTTYIGMAALPLAAFMWLWSLTTNLSSDGNPYPLIYLPLLNPLDLAQIFVFIVLAFWLLKIRELDLNLFREIPREVRYAAIALPLFVWLNAALLRTLHYWADVPLNMHSMMHSVLVQASISIFWSVLAMGLMRYAAQKQHRSLWMTGGALMGAVVFKLFTVDISGIGSLERIVSFIGVALLMLIIGYIAPLPAKQPIPVKQDEGAN